MAVKIHEILHPDGKRRVAFIEEEKGKIFFQEEEHVAMKDAEMVVSFEEESPSTAGGEALKNASLWLSRNPGVGETFATLEEAIRSAREAIPWLRDQ